MAKIVIIEDELALAEAFQMILRKDGHDVKVAHNGEEGLAITKEHEPDLILLDLLMPVKNGTEFLEEYKQKTLHPNVKIIIFSNLDMQKEAERAFELGASKYILKSWATPKTLTRIVKEQLTA